MEVTENPKKEIKKAFGAEMRNKMPNRTIWDGKGWEQTNRMDEKIREELIRTAEPVPDSYEQKVKEVLQHLPDRKKYRWTFPRAASVAAIVGVLVVSSGVAAGVKLYQKRLESMKPEQVGELYSMIQMQQIDAYMYSREMSATEEEKFAELRDQYENEGLFPEQEIACVKTEKDVKLGELCYCYENGTFYLPERELSEEELLQIVDFYYKVNYSLEKIQEDRNGGEPEDTEEKIVDISGTEEGNVAAEKGRKLVEDLYGWNTDGAVCKVERDEDFDVMIEKEEWEKDVRIVFERGTMKFLWLGIDEKNVDDEKSSILDGRKIDEKHYRNYGKKVWRMAKKIVPEENIKEFWLGYYRNKDGETIGKVMYYLTCEDGGGYLISYRITSEIVNEIVSVLDIKKYIRTASEVVGYDFVLKKCNIH